MAAIPNIINMISGINERRRNARVDDALKNYFNDPQGTINAVMEVAPRMGIELDAQRTERENTRQQQRRTRATENLNVLGRLTRGLDPETADYGAAIDQLTPTLTGTYGMTPEEVANMRAAATSNRGFLSGLDDKAFGDASRARTDTTVATPGSQVWVGGRQRGSVPFAPRVQVVRGGDGSSVAAIFDPNTGEFVTQGTGSNGSTGQGDGEGDMVLPATGQTVRGAPTAAPAPAATRGAMTVENMRGHIRAQESNNDYTQVNRETGALGAYQVMPATGSVLARRLGLPWRPDMMTRSDPAAVRYQDAIGGAAIQEAIDASGGDVRTMGMYYHGGSNRNGWRERTQRYGNDIVARWNGQNPRAGGRAAPAAPTSPQQVGGATITPTTVTTGGRAPKAPTAAWRNMSPQEVAAAGYPEGTIVQVNDVNGQQQVRGRPPRPTAASARNTPQAQVERATNMADTMGRLRGFATDLLNHPGLDGAQGWVAGRLPAMGQDAQNYRNSLDAMTSNVGLSTLLQFKAQSSQGASGFGNLSNEEGRRLERLYGSLATTNSPAEQRRVLREIIQVATTAETRARVEIRNAQRSQTGQGGQPAAVGSGSVAVGTVITRRGQRHTMTARGWNPPITN